MYYECLTSFSRDDNVVASPTNMVTSAGANRGAVLQSDWLLILHNKVNTLQILTNELLFCGTDTIKQTKHSWVVRQLGLLFPLAAEKFKCALWRYQFNKRSQAWI